MVISNFRTMDFNELSKQLRMLEVLLYWLILKHATINDISAAEYRCREEKKINVR